MGHQILAYPSPALGAKAKPIPAGNAAILDLAGLLASVVHDSGALAVSAPQLGIAVRAFAFRRAGDRKITVLINPEIVRRGEAVAKRLEACLSSPAVRVYVERPATCTVSFWTLDGEPTEAECDGQDAAVVQHEVDHLDGRCFIEHLDPARRARLERSMERFGGTLLAARRQEIAAAELDDEDDDLDDAGKAAS